MTIHYFLRPLTLRDRDAGAIVYAARGSNEKRDPVRVIGAFPLGWRPTDNPGQAHLDRSCTFQYWETHVPRSSFKHYRKIGEAEALRLYPRLPEFLTELEPAPTPGDSESATPAK
jgi:hypothetical protein